MDTVAQINALHRSHYRAVVAPLIRILGSFAAAEDAAQDAFAQALRTWPSRGIPEQPVAWLRRVAKNRAVDQLRRHKSLAAKEELLIAGEQAAFEAELGPDEIRDDTLRLVFTCCHPSLSAEAQVALTLTTVCGLTSDQVARSFLLKTTTLQQRLVRAKRKIDVAKIPYIVPAQADMPSRLHTVLRTVYLVFNEGYGPSDGDAVVRVDLAEEAIRLGRLLTDLLPQAAAADGLLALMLLHHSRRNARADADGNLITLEQQDRDLWDGELIADALPRVERALQGKPVSTYAIEASIAALHAQARTAEATDWVQIAALYQQLLPRSGNSPVVALNAAVATAMAGDVATALGQLDALEATGALAGYHLLPAARADLLRRAGQREPAAEAYRAALSLVTNPVERRFLTARLQQVVA